MSCVAEPAEMCLEAHVRVRVSGHDMETDRRRNRRRNVGRIVLATWDEFSIHWRSGIRSNNLDRCAFISDLM
jgi:hypothetical protein